MKIKVKSIHFPFSESDNSALEKIYSNWEDAEKALASVIPPDIGYYKTDFVITYEDGETYQGRFDIGSDADTLADHINDFSKLVINNTHGRYKSETIKSYQEFVEKYQIGV
jgi:hypothetical protein